MMAGRKTAPVQAPACQLLKSLLGRIDFEFNTELWQSQLRRSRSLPVHILRAPSCAQPSKAVH